MEVNRGESIVKGEKVAILTGTRESGTKGQGTGDLRKVAFEELNATIDTIVRTPELRTES